MAKRKATTKSVKKKTPTKKKAAKKKATKSTKSKPATKSKGASSPKRSSGTRKKVVESKEVEQEVGEQEVKIDRRRKSRRSEKVEGKAKATKKKRIAANEEKGEELKSPAKLERRAKVNRRRQIDPTTCERDYSDDELEFMNALDEYKRKNGRMFPTCSEVLEVLRSLGYVKSGLDPIAAGGEGSRNVLDVDGQPSDETSPFPDLGLSPTGTEVDADLV